MERMPNLFIGVLIRTEVQNIAIAAIITADYNVKYG